MRLRPLLNLCLLVFLITSCKILAPLPLAPETPTTIPPTVPPSTPTPQVTRLQAQAVSPTFIPTQTPPQPEPTATAAATPTRAPRPTLGPDDWEKIPVVPESVSQRVRLIYQMGLMAGNDPRAFSKVGDCNMTNPYFLTGFDQPGSYDLGEYTSLQETIDYFSGSHARTSLAAKQGLTAHAVLSMLWNTWKECETYETPLTCEYRIHKPMYAIIAFGTNDANGNVDFEKALRRVIDMTIGNGTIPILATKADNAEGDHSLNRTIVKLADEYELPVWNYWLAVQPLPLSGLLDAEHLEHLSVGPLGYTNFQPENLEYGWSMRNLTALQVLDSVRRSVEDAD